MDPGHSSTPLTTVISGQPCPGSSTRPVSHSTGLLFSPVQSPARDLRLSIALLGIQQALAKPLPQSC